MHICAAKKIVLIDYINGVDPIMVVIHALIVISTVAALVDNTQSG